MVFRRDLIFTIAAVERLITFSEVIYKIIIIRKRAEIFKILELYSQMLTNKTQIIQLGFKHMASKYSNDAFLIEIIENILKQTEKIIEINKDIIKMNQNTTELCSQSQDLSNSEHGQNISLNLTKKD